jgi:regulator of replication initiation timing
MEQRDKYQKVENLRDKTHRLQGENRKLKKSAGQKRPENTTSKGETKKRNEVQHTTNSEWEYV